MAPSKPTAIILVAGLGSRLGRPHPKCLTRLDNGETILGRQVRLLRSRGLSIIAVVGFKLELVMESEPDLLFVYNPNFDTTNTSKSLLCALRQAHADVLWMNGDVVFDQQVLERILSSSESAVAVNSAQVGEEEVKYLADSNGYVSQISKQVRDAHGESLGINLISASDLQPFRDALDEVDDQDYFERGMELMIERRGPVFRAIDVSDLACIEVDFESDLRQANELLSDR